MSRDLEPRGEDLSRPSVTVVMALRNEAAFVHRSVGAALAQDYAGPLEVVVADGMSSDATRAVLGELASRHENLRVIDNPRGIVAAGLNAALRHAKGEVIVRVDGHTEIASDYVRQCVAELARTGADNVGGRMTAAADGLAGAAIALATSSPFGVGGARFHYSNRREWVDTVYLGAWRREVFDRIGVFDEELVRDQDDELNYRLRKQGGRILLSPAVRSVYHGRCSLRSLWRQYFQYGTWKVRVLQKHPRQMRPRQFAPPLFAALLVGLSASSPFSLVARRALATLLAAYGAGAIGASALSARRGRWRFFPILPPVFAILHLSYGLGFLTGLARFAGRWKEPRDIRRVPGPESRIPTHR